MRFLFAIFFSVLVAGSSAQYKAQIPEDFGVWTGIKLSHKFNKKWIAFVAPEFRTYENSRLIRSAFSDQGVQYRLNKHFRFTSAYRYSQRVRLGNRLEPRHRIAFQMEGILKLHKKLEGSARIRYQYNTYKRKDPLHYFRFQMELTYDMGANFEFTPGIEFFNQLNSPEGPIHDATRMGLELAHKLNKKNKIKVYYIREWSRNIGTPNNFNALGIGYNVKI